MGAALGVVLAAAAAAAAPAAAPDAGAPAPAAAAPTAAPTAAPAAAATPAAAGIGTAHPIELVAAAAGGEWAVICQARRDTNRDGTVSVGRHRLGGTYGDALSAYLVVGSGAGQPVDDLLAAHPDSGRLVVVRRGRVVLLHPGVAAAVDLSRRGAYAHLGRGPRTTLRAQASFDAAGTRLLYLARTRGGAPRLVVRALASGHEVTVPLPPGRLWDARFASGSDWIAITMVRPGGNPPQRDEAPRHCFTGALGDVVRGGDTTEWVAPPTGAPPRPRTAAVLALAGPELLRRDPSGAIVAEPVTGTPRVIVPAACGGRLLGADEARRRLVVACTRRGRPAPVWIFGDGPPRATPARVIAPAQDLLRVAVAHLFLTTADADDTVLELATGARWTAPSYQRLVAATPAGTLIRRRTTLVWRAAGGRERVLGTVPEYPDVVRGGDTVVVDRLVVDLRRGVLRGRLPVRTVPFSRGSTLTREIPAEAVAVARDGRVLVELRDRPSGFPRGPLEWIAPEKSK